ncbi:E3 ubiquitin-protein ligase, partial [Schistosoma japonicum]
TPVPSISLQNDTLWRRIILAGHQLFRSSSPLSHYDFNKYFTPHSPSAVLLNTTDEFDHSVISKPLQLDSNHRHIPTSTDSPSSLSVATSGRYAIQSPSSSISSFTPLTMSTTQINAIVSLPAISMSVASNPPRDPSSSSSSNPMFLIQALASILAGSETGSNIRGGGLIFPPLSAHGSVITSDAQHLNENNISFIPSSTALSLRELFGSRISNNGLPSSTTSSMMTGKTITSSSGVATSTGAVTCVLRLPSPGRSSYSYFLVIASTGPKSLCSSSDIGVTSSANTTTSDSLKASRMSPFSQRGLMTIYCLDRLLAQIAAKQDDGLKEVTKLKSIIALFQSRHVEIKAEPYNENESEECVVMSLSSVGQVCGRISVVPVVGTRREQIIKAIWLPNSIKLLAILTDQSVQKLGPDCLSSLGPFFLAESLEWDITSLKKVNATTGRTTTTDDLVGIPELTRDCLTGVLGGGGVSLQYISSMGLLLHAYQSGHSVASGIKLFNTSDKSSKQAQNMSELRITNSFLLAIGPSERNVLSSGSNISSAKFTRNSPIVHSDTSYFDSDNLLASLLLAAHSGIYPSLQSPRIHHSSVRQANQRLFIPSIGPLYRWTEVSDHPGLVSAVSKIHFMPNSPSQHQSYLMAFEPDQVWIQHVFAHPRSQHFNICDSTIKSTTTSKVVPPTPTTATTSATTNLSGVVKVISSDNFNSGQALSPSTQLLDSFSFHWFGSPQHIGRTVTLLLTSDGHLLANATVPRSSLYTLQNITESNSEQKKPNYKLAVLPGQYWLQNDFSEKSLSSFNGIMSAKCGLLSNGPVSINSLMLNLPKGPLWDLATTFYKFSEGSKHNNNNNKVSRKKSLTLAAENSIEMLQKYLIESPAFGPLPVDFFEHVSETAEVDFDGADLLQFYNYEQLRRRLTTPGNPVTGVGSYTRKNSNQRRDDKHATLKGPILPSNTSASTSTGVIATKSKDLSATIGQQSQQHVAYIIDIHNRRPKDTLLAGLRIALPAVSSTGENASRWPRFFKLFDRTILVPLPYPGMTSARTIDLPLYRCEMLKSHELLQLVVGTSDDPEDMTSIDCIIVYAIDRDLVSCLPQSYPTVDLLFDEQHQLQESHMVKYSRKKLQSSLINENNSRKAKGPMDLFVIKNNNGIDELNMSNNDDNLNKNLDEVCNNLDELVKNNVNIIEQSLAFRLDRLFGTGFVTELVLNDNKRSTGKSRSRLPQLYSTKPFPSPPSVTFILADSMQCLHFTSGDSSVPLCLLSDYCGLTASISNMLCAVVNMGIASNSKKHHPSLTGFNLILSSLMQNFKKRATSTTTKVNLTLENSLQSPSYGLNILIAEIIKYLNWIESLTFLSDCCNRSAVTTILPTFTSLAIHLYQLAFMTVCFLNIEELVRSTNSVESILSEILYNPLNYSWDKLCNQLNILQSNMNDYDDIISRHVSVVESIRLISQFSMQIYHLLYINPLDLIQMLSKHAHNQQQSKNISVFYSVLHRLFNVFVTNLPVHSNPLHTIDPIWPLKFDMLPLTTLRQDMAYSPVSIMDNVKEFAHDPTLTSLSSSPTSVLILKPKSYFNQSIQCFINPLIRALYTILLSTDINTQSSSSPLVDDNASCDELIMKSLIKPPNEQVNSLDYGKLLIVLLSHSNILISCASRDSLCRLILNARPKSRIVWSKLHLSMSRRYNSCYRKSSLSRPVKSVSESNVSQNSVTDLLNVQGSSLIYTTPSLNTVTTPTVSSGRSFQSRTTPYSGRRRPPREYHSLQPSQLIDVLLNEENPRSQELISLDDLDDIDNHRVMSLADSRQDTGGDWYSGSGSINNRQRRSSHFLRILNRPLSVPIWDGETRSSTNSMLAVNVNEPVRYMDMENDILDDYSQSDMNLDTDTNNAENILFSELLDLSAVEPSISSSLRYASDDDRACRILRLCRRIWGSRRVHEAQVHEPVETPNTTLRSNAPGAIRTDSRTVSHADSVREWEANNVIHDDEDQSGDVRRQETSSEEAIDVHPNLLDVDDAQEGLDMWGFSENLEDDVLLTLALQLSLRDQGGSSTRDDVGENNQQSVDTPRLQSISQEVVTIRENENVNQMELNNEQDFEEFSQLADSTGWSVESGVPETSFFLLNPILSLLWLSESSNQSAVETTLQNPYHGEIDVEYVTSVATEEEDFPGLYSLFEETTLSPKAVELACLDKAHSRSLHTATSINSTANTSTNRNKNRNVCIKSEEMLLTDAADSRSISSTNMSSDGNNDDISNDSAPESNILRNSYRYDNLKSLYYSTSVSLDDVDDNNESAFADSGDDVHDSARNSNIDVFPSDTDYHHHQANNSSENNNEPNDNKQISFLLKSLTKSLLSSKYRRQNLALLFCLNMSNYLSTE